MELKTYASDEAKKKDGVWIEFDGARFKIRSTDSPAYRRAVDAAAKKRSPTKVRKDPETQTDIGIEAIALGALIDWEGLTDDGAPIECTRENKLRVIKSIPTLRDFLAAEASDMTNYAAEGIVADSADFHKGD